MADTLRRYREKRDFSATPEPAPGPAATRDGPLSFVVQKHDARRLHYDLRLELGGVMKSWAVTKGPSLDPAEKRLAVETEDHPLDYAAFEGTIPQGEYGGGTVMVWDRGTWEAEAGKDPAEGLAKGSLTFRLHGERLKGRWHLQRLRDGKGGRTNWLLIKSRDDAAREDGKPVTERFTKSVATGRGMDAIARGRPAPASAGEGSTTKGGAGKAPAGKGRGTAPDEAKLPRFVAPELCRSREVPPKGEGWLAEVKYDGYRAILRAAPEGVRILTRSEKDWTERFPDVAREAARLGPRRVMLDGELVVFDPDGRTNFGALQRAFRKGEDLLVRYVAFDCLFADGEDLRERPIEERKARLAELVEGFEAIRYGDHVAGGRQGALYAHARELGLEGIIAKRAGSRYRSGRHDDWVKVRAVRTAPFVIGGWTDGAGGGLGAIVVGGHADGRLVSAGRVGTGFTRAAADGLLAELRGREARRSPFSGGASAGKGVHWVRPELVASVAYLAITDDGALRHPVFKGLADGPADAVRLPSEHPAAQLDRGADGATAGAVRTAAPARRPAGEEIMDEALGVALSSPDRVLFPEQGVTKADLVRHYLAHMELMLPHVAGRPLTLVRCPQGRQKKCFFQRHPDGLPDRMGRDLPGEEGGVIVIEEGADVVELVQRGVLEIHVRGGRWDRPERPDRLVFDLDPGEGVPFEVVREAAFEVRDRLEAEGLVSFALATGGKGLHVVVPVERRTPWDAAKAFTRRLAEDLVHDAPDRYLVTMSKARRKGKIFVDYLRNDRKASAIAPFSTRAREGAPFACPVAWDDLAALEGAAPVSVGDVVEADATADLVTTRQRLTKRHLEPAKRKRS